MRSSLAGTVRLLAAIGSAAPLLTVSAQVAPVSVSVGDSARVAVPGTALSVFFTIDAPAGIHSGSAEVVLPLGWRLITGGGSLPETSTRLSYMIAALVPSNAAAGHYRIELKAQVKNGHSSASVVVVVPEQRALSLDIIAAPQVMGAGDNARAVFLLNNRGNVRTTVRLRIRKSQPYSIDTVMLDLNAGEAREIPVEVAAATGWQLYHSVTSVSAEALGYRNVTAASSFRTTVAPTRADALLPVHTIASRIRMIGSPSVSGASGAEISGGGALVEGSATRLDYVARNMFGKNPIFGDRSEYRVALAAPAYNVIAGDQVAHMTPLTQRGRLARGLRADFTSNGWTIGGSLTREAARIPRPLERAAFLNRDFGNGIFLGVNYLDPADSNKGSVVSVRSVIRSLPIGTVDAELGHAITGSAAEAWRVSADGSFERLSYSLFREKADAGYPGDGSGKETLSASFNARPLNDVRVRALVNDYMTSRTSLVIAQSRSRHWSRLAAMSLKSLLDLELIRNGRDDAGFAKVVRRSETLGVVRVAGKISGLSVSGSAGRGTGHADSARSIARYSAHASARVWKQARVSVNIEALKGGTLLLPDEKSEMRAGIGIDLSTRAGVFQLNGSVTQHELVQRLNDTNVEMSWTRTGSNNRTLSLRARIHRNPLVDSPEDNVIRAEYSIPFGMPVAPSRTRGRIAGELVDAATGKGIAKAAVTLGTLVTLTDAEGRFVFSTDSENPLSLNIGGSLSTAGLVSIDQLPLTVYPRFGHTQNFRILFTPAARIDGRIHLFVPAPGFGLDDERPPVEDSASLRRVRVEASCNGDVRQSLATSSGHFSFTGLRPGTCILAIRESDMPSQSVIAGDSVVATVRAGSVTRVSIDIVPRKRRVRRASVEQH